MQYTFCSYFICDFYKPLQANDGIVATLKYATTTAFLSSIYFTNNILRYITSAVENASLNKELMAVWYCNKLSGF
jgi:hypothetical protein